MNEDYQSSWMHLQKNDASKKVLEEFWKSYTKRIFDFNLTEFSQLSAHFQIPMPPAEKIQEVGNRHLNGLFQEIWGTGLASHQSTLHRQSQQGVSHSRFQNQRNKPYNRAKKRYSSGLSSKSLTNWSDDETSERAIEFKHHERASDLSNKNEETGYIISDDDV